MKKITNELNIKKSTSPADNGLEPWQQPDFDHVAGEEVLRKAANRLKQLLAYVDAKIAEAEGKNNEGK